MVILNKDDLFVGEGNTVLSFEPTYSTGMVSIIFADEEGYVKSLITPIKDVLTESATERYNRFQDFLSEIL